MCTKNGHRSPELSLSWTRFHLNVTVCLFPSSEIRFCSARTRSRKDRKIIDNRLRRFGIPALITAAAGYGLFFIAWLVLAVLLVMSYRPTDVPFTYVTVLSYPLLAVMSVGAGFVLYRRNRFRAAFLFLLLPLINICLLLLSFVPIWPESR